MKKIILASFVLINSSLLLVQSVYAQAKGESFFDKYLPIAELFDFPPFRYTVFASAALIVVWLLFFIVYAKMKEKRAERFGESKTPEELLELLHSPVSQESQMAFMYLRCHTDEAVVKLLIKELETRKQRHAIDPKCIYLLEDAYAKEALPILTHLAKKQSQIAIIANNAFVRISDHLEYLAELEAEGKKKKQAKA